MLKCFMENGVVFRGDATPSHPPSTGVLYASYSRMQLPDFYPALKRLHVKQC